MFYSSSPKSKQVPHQVHPKKRIGESEGESVMDEFREGVYGGSGQALDARFWES